jgi:hypothetical protein
MRQAIWCISADNFPCRSGLAREVIDAVLLKHRVACIAGKPAPTRAAEA